MHSRLLFAFLSVVPLAAAGSETQPVSIEALVADVVGRHPEVRFYEAEIAVARASVRRAATRDHPELSIEVGRKRVTESTGALGGEGTTWALSLAQTFEWPGRLALRKAIADRDLAAAELGLSRFEATLRGRARSLAFGLVAANEQRSAVQEVADRFRALKETFLAREPGGLTPLLETRVIEAQELVLQRRATQANLSVHAALVELNQLRGVAAETPLVLAGAKLKFGDAPRADDLLAAAQERNFEFRARLLELERQGAGVQLARNEKRPSVTVAPFFAQETAGERERSFGVGVSLPLPVSARGSAAVDIAEARRVQAEAAVAAARRELEREVVVTAQQFATLVGEIRNTPPDAVATFREAAALADRHYRLGAVPVATYVELQSAYLDALEALLATQREALEAGLKLELISGVAFGAVEVVP